MKDLLLGIGVDFYVSCHVFPKLIRNYSVAVVQVKLCKYNTDCAVQL